VDIEYENAAQAYLRSLPPEHFMEAVPQATQRKIFVVSADLIEPHHPEMHSFNELLVQYPHGRPPVIRQVVPDNMVVLHDGPIRATTSFNLPLQPAGPFWVLEYVSKGSQRKDYEESFDKYEKELKVPYYLVFYPDNQELTLYRHTGRKYRTVTPNENGRYPIPELELELGLLEGWVRFWFRGELLPLPAELQEELDQTRRLLEEERHRADREARRAEKERRRADHEAQRANHEARARQALEEEVARLRAQLGLPPDSAR
jgi:hypothetical protein